MKLCSNCCRLAQGRHRSVLQAVISGWKDGLLYVNSYRYSFLVALMRMPRFSTAALLATGLGVANADRAEAVVFDISWTGNQATLEGQLAFDDGLLGTGVINETQIDVLSFEVFFDGVSLGTASLATFDPLAIFELNFDTDTGQFVVGGPSGDQNWNVGGPLGFFSGPFGQGVSLFDTALDEIPVANSTLTATIIPVPASVLLLLTGLGALCLARRRR